MRELMFIVRGQALSKDPNCNFSGIIRGSKGYLNCKFDFDSSWDECRKVVEFITDDGSSFFELDAQNGCNVPDKVALKNYFNIRLYAVSGNTEYHTNKVLVRQERG